MNTLQRKIIPSMVARISFASVTAVALLLAARPAAADDCMQTVWKAHGNKQNLTCSANDVTLSSVDITCIVVEPAGGPRDPDGDGCQNPNSEGKLTCADGQPFKFKADYRMPLTAQERYDIGLYVSLDGDTNGDLALTGICKASVVTAATAPDTYFQSLNDDQLDVCGDIDSVKTPQVITQEITAVCDDPEGDGVNLPFCTTWRQPGADQLCDSIVFTTAATFDAYPGAPSKCNCGVLDIDVFTETASITVEKTVSPDTVPESGGVVTYTVSVTNNAQESSLQLDDLFDDIYDDITLVGGEILSTTCELVNIQAGAVPDVDPDTVNNPYVCTFEVLMPEGNVGDTVTDTVEACGTDEFGHSDICDDDDATVTYVDTPGNPTLVKDATATLSVSTQLNVQYQVTVSNPDVVGDILTLETLVDDKFGSITAAHPAGPGFEAVVSTTCGVAAGNGGPGTLPAIIPPGGAYSCSFVGTITGAATFDPVTQTFKLTHVNRASGTATDEDGVNYGDPPLGDNAAVNVSVAVAFQ